MISSDYIAVVDDFGNILGYSPLQVQVYGAVAVIASLGVIVAGGALLPVEAGAEIGTVPKDGTVVGAEAAGAAPNLLKLGQKFNKNANSPAGANVLEDPNLTVLKFIAENRTASILRVFPKEYLNMTIGEALKTRGSTVRRLIIDGRFSN